MTPSDPIGSVLVYVGFDRLGDSLLKLPFVRGLRAAFPDARVTWLAGRETSVYADLMAPAVAGLLDEVIENAGVGLSPWELVLGHSKGPLGHRRFDLLIDTQRIVWTSLSLRRIGHGTFISPAGRFLLSSRKPAPGYRFPDTMQRQLLDLLEIASGQAFATPERLDLPISEDARDAALALLPAGPDYIGIAPGSGGPPKCWPLGRFVELARGQSAKGRVPVFLLGPKEADWLAEIRDAVPGALFPLQDETIAAAFGFSPFLTVALAERMAAAVSNDSGAAHLIAVGGAPLAVLYGVTAPKKFAPMTDRLAVVRAQDFGGRDLHRIPVAAAEAALEGLMAEDQAGAGSPSSPMG